MEPNELELREELLADSVPEPKAPPRGSKQALIDKIIELSERDQIPLDISNTKLKRMNKEQLTSLCADMVEKGVRKKLQRAVGAESDDETCIALGALRMLHDMAAMACEKGGNYMLTDYGYEIDGFSESLKQEPTSSAINGCLEEIAQENAEILEYVKSPYTRLFLCWTGGIAFSCRRVKQQNVTHMGPRTARRQNPVRRSGRRRPEDGQIHSNNPLAQPISKQV